METTKDLFKILSYLSNKKFKKGSAELSGYNNELADKVFLNPQGGDVAKSVVELAEKQGLIDIFKDHNDNDVAWLTPKGESVYNNTIKSKEKEYNQDFEIKNLQEEIAKIMLIIQ